MTYYFKVYFWHISYTHYGSCVALFYAIHFLKPRLTKLPLLGSLVAEVGKGTRKIISLYTKLLLQMAFVTFIHIPLAK